VTVWVEERETTGMRLLAFVGLKINFATSCAKASLFSSFLLSFLFFFLLLVTCGSVWAKDAGCSQESTQSPPPPATKTHTHTGRHDRQPQTWSGELKDKSKKKRGGGTACPQNAAKKREGRRCTRTLAKISLRTLSTTTT